MLEMDQWLVWDSFFFLSRIFFLWIINIFLSAQVTESRRSISRTDGDLEIWTWEYAEARWDRVHSMWGKNWNIPQKNRLARCSKNTFSFLPGHIITSFFHLPLGSGMELSSGQWNNDRKMYQTWSRNQFSTWSSIFTFPGSAW